jgi:hypothetical protein
VTFQLYETSARIPNESCLGLLAQEWQGHLGPKKVCIPSHERPYNAAMRKYLYPFALCAAAILALGFGWQGDGFKRERNGKTDSLKDQVEGKAPPKLIASEWLNSKPLTWEALKGKVVLIDFWAHW